MDHLPLIIARVFPRSGRFETRRERFAVGLALVIISARPLEDPSKAHVAQGVLISRKKRSRRSATNEDLLTSRSFNIGAGNEFYQKHEYYVLVIFICRCLSLIRFGRHSKSVNLEKSRCAYCHR